ncbi:E3 ubiquitin-protein ligase complex slx8-rfp subunit slx8 [Drosophila busckii]|uniref:E3 ubiquitin-protein ligase complex slx8-rfp subunit slx8 n=1 Tax=Drosophila busckii TaxID=30019 RepID=UPI00083F255A|nr:E3 ubiquitin-protein ligase complex slx8-rfp subunit slx8 [Drosophila busckii]
MSDWLDLYDSEPRSPISVASGIGFSDSGSENTPGGSIDSTSENTATTSEDSIASISEYISNRTSENESSPSNHDETSLVEDSTSQFSLQQSLNEGSVQAEMENIRLFCDNIANNLAQIGLSADMGAFPSASTPRATNTFDISLTIDVSEYERARRLRAARSRQPDEVIDLCSPTTPRRLPSFINLEDYDTPRRARDASREPLPLPPKHEKEVNVSNDNSYKCPVCLEPAHERLPSSTRCGHVFCKVCIETAARTTHKCPLCNKKITARHISRIYL